MFKYQLVVAATVLSTLALAGCAKTSTSSNPAANPAPQTAGPNDAVPSIPTSAAQPSDQTEGQVNQQVPALPSLPATAQNNPNQNPAANAPVIPAPVVNPKPAPVANGAPVVTGLGSATRDPKDLTAQGISAGIFEARFCSITGKFSDGSDCYLVFSDGSTQQQSPGNRALIQDYIKTLQAQLDQQNGKKTKKTKPS